MQEEQPLINKEQRDERLDSSSLPLDERMTIAKEELDEKLKKDKKPKGKNPEFVPTTFAAESSRAMDEKEDNKKSRGSLPGYDSGEIE